MRTRHARTTWNRAPRAAGAFVTAVTALALVAGVSDSAQAKPPVKPGNVTGLSITSMTQEDATYTVEAGWNTATNATSYLVKLTNIERNRSRSGAGDGPVVRRHHHASRGRQGDRLGDPLQRQATWSHDRHVRLPSRLHRSGRDLHRSARTTLADGNVTVTQTSVSDNLSAPAQLTQSIDWGDGSPNSTGPGTQTTFPHAYPTTPAVHHPVVTLTDGAGNDVTYTLAAAVNDLSAPTGTFAVSPATGYARWTTVTLTQQAIGDNLSAEADIARSVDWGDGPAEPWTTGTTLTHTYDAAGTYDPTVTLTDEANNASAPLATSAVTVTADTVKPVVRLRLPTTNKQSVSKWTTLRGRATDAQTGVRNVRVKVVEKRHGTWYAYRADTGRWATAASQRGAWKKATLSTVTPNGRRWSVPVKRLRVGLLVYRAAARDNVGNSSAWRTHQQLLTRP